MMKKKTNNRILFSAFLLAVSVLTPGCAAEQTKSIADGRLVLAAEPSMVTDQAAREAGFVTGGYTADNPNVILNPYGNAPLSALILYESKEAEAPVITVRGKDEHTTYTHTFASATVHELPVLGLYAGTDNQVTLTSGSTVRELTITTDPLPADFVLPLSVQKDADQLGTELYFYTPASTGYTCAYDVNGDVRWYLSEKAPWDNKLLANGHMMVATERLVNPPYYMSGLYEIDFTGKIYKEYSLPGGYHHDYYEMPSGNLLVASDNFEGNGTVEDTVVELDRSTGAVVKTFSLQDVLDTKDGRSENATDYDWFHNNAVWYDEKTDSVLLSGRHKDAVVDLDYATGRLNWILGDPDNWDEAYQKYFFTPSGTGFEWQYSQHAAMVTPDGQILLFDNGNNKSKDPAHYVPAADSYSRVVMYRINTQDHTVEQTWEYGKERGSSFYSPYISDVDYLGEDHYLIVSGGISYKDGAVQNEPAGLCGADTLRSDTVELKNGSVVFEMILPTNTYRVEKLNLYGNSEFSAGTASRLGSLGETPVSSTDAVDTVKAVQPDQAYSDAKISLKRQEDRLVFQGAFARGTDLHLILNSGSESRSYYVRVSQRPYTALCINVFDNAGTDSGPISVAKYINSEGMSGLWNIYVEIGDVLYDTGDSVQF